MPEINFLPRLFGPWASAGLLSVVIAGCGGASAAPLNASADLGAAHVVSGECSASASSSASVSAGPSPNSVSTTRTSSQTSAAITEGCRFVATDGERFDCSTSFGHSTPSLARLSHDRACRRLSPVKIAPAQLRVVARVEMTRACLRRHGLRSTGGAVFVNGSSNPAVPHGELVVQDAYLAFYIGAAEARSGAAGLAANAARFNGKVEQHGAAAIIWSRPPSSALRSAVETCIAP